MIRATRDILRIISAVALSAERRSASWLSVSVSGRRR
jgi:hypothetical protein